MVFFVNKLRRDPRFGNPTIVAVTDRTDLDDQLARDVHRHASGAVVSSRRTEIAGGPDSLHELLNVPAGGIVFTTIQKFAPPKGGKMPVLSERENVDRDGGRGAPLAVREVRGEHHDRAAERGPDRVHRHAGREGRPLDAGWCSATTSRCTGCARRRRTTRRSRSTTSRGRSRSRSPTPTSSRTSRRCSRPRRTRRQRSWSRRGRSSRRSSARPIGCSGSPTTSQQHYQRALRGAGRQGDGRRVLRAGSPPS